MKKFLLTTVAMLLGLSVMAATWVAADRVSPVGTDLLSKNKLSSMTFKVVNGAADNSTTSTTKIVQVSSTDLTYAGNDNEVAAVVATELGQLINGKTAKDRFRTAAKAALAEKLSSDNVLNTAANSAFVANKASLKDYKLADMTGVDLMVQAGYNPLAMVVVITKAPGSNIELVMGKPANSERAMNVYDYISYNYPEKLKAGYSCQEYRNFLAYAEPIVTARNKSKRSLNKFNKEQAKNKTDREKVLNQYKTTGGITSLDATYTIIDEFSKSKK